MKSIAQLLAAGEATVENGHALRAEGREDLAVADECRRRARARGLNPVTTRVGMVMSRDEEIAFRDEIRKAA